MSRIKHDLRIPVVDLTTLSLRDLRLVTMLWSCRDDRNYDKMEKLAMEILCIEDISDSVAREIARLLTAKRPKGPQPVSNDVLAFVVKEEWEKNGRTQIDAAIQAAFERLRDAPGFIATDGTSKASVRKLPNPRKVSYALVKEAWYQWRDFLTDDDVTHCDPNP